MFNCCGAGWAVIGQLRVAWSAHWTVIGWCLLLAVSAIGCAPAAGCWLLGATFPPPRLRHTTQDSLRRTPRPRRCCPYYQHTGAGTVTSGDAPNIANHVWRNKFCFLCDGSLSFLVNRNFLLLRQFLSAKWPTKLHVCYVKCFQNFL